MADLMSSNENNSFFDWPLALMAFGIPFTIKLGNIFIIAGFLFSLYAVIKFKPNIFKKRPSFELLFPVVLFLVVLTSTIFSHDVGAGLRQVEKNILFPLIAFAIVLINSRRNVNIKLILKGFSIATLLSTLVLVIVAMLRFWRGEGFDVLFFHELGRLFDLHPVYIAINLAITIFFITNEYLAGKNLVPKKLFVLVLVLCFAITALFLCASKAVLLCFVVLYVIQLFSIYKSVRLRFVLFLGLVLLSFLVAVTPKISDRFLQGLHFDIEEFHPTNEVYEAKVFSNLEKNEISDLELRYLMFKTGIFHVMDDGKLIFGYGIGDVQHHIDYYYMLYGLAPGWFEGYNLHNQYLQYLVTYGVIVLLFFIGYLVFSFNKALTNKNQLHLFFLILISTTFLFECLLSRNKGIVIFIFINTLFLIHYKNENSHSRH
jgi:hypothetical protein